MITKQVRMNGKLKTFDCYPVIEQCEGCGNVKSEGEEAYCGVYQRPAFMWKDDTCLGATHVEHEIVSAATEQKINPLKASKRASRGG